MLFNIPITAIIMIAFVVGVVSILAVGAINTVFDKKTVLISIITVVLLVIVGFGGLYLYYNKTESGKRDARTWQSNISAGINRRVRVYDVDGDLLEEYEGQFDIEYSDERILFDDEQGNRHIIYFKTGTVLVDEVA